MAVQQLSVITASTWLELRSHVVGHCSKGRIQIHHLVSVLDCMKLIGRFDSLGGIKVVLVASPFLVLLWDHFARFGHAGQRVNSSKNAIQLHSILFVHAVGSLIFTSSIVSGTKTRVDVLHALSIVDASRELAFDFVNTGIEFALRHAALSWIIIISGILTNSNA